MNSDKVIIITHLTTRQKAMLDQMWSLDSLDQIQEYQLTLAPDDFKLSISLVELVKVESLDLIQQESGDLTLAQQALNKYMSH